MEKTLKIFDKIHAPVDLQNIEASHRLKPDDNGWSKKVIVKFSKHKGYDSSNEQKEILEKC